MPVTASAVTAHRPPTRRRTDGVLLAGVLAGPLFVVGGVAQALLRDGFEPTRHAWSLLANGDLGWVHQTLMILTGLLAAAGGLALRERGARGAAPTLIAAYGVMTALAGVFRADPMDGFPRGTPEGPPASLTLEGVLHMVTGMAAFGCLIAACLLVGRRRRRTGTGGRGSTAVGVLYLGALAGIMTGAGHPLLLLAFVTAVLVGWAWLTVLLWSARAGGLPSGLVPEAGV